MPDCGFTLSEEHFLELQHTVDPLQKNDNYGIDLYEQTVGFIFYSQTKSHHNGTIYQ